jgi:ABC-type sugar transport system permease subunit
LAIAVFLYLPLATTLAFSLFDIRYRIDLRPETFVGFDNYARLLASAPFWQSFGFTLYFTVCVVAGELVLGLAMALLALRAGRCRAALMRSVMVVTWAIPPIMHAAIWKWLFQTDAGLVGDLLVRLRLAASPPPFLADPWLARHCVIVAQVWRGAGLTGIMLLGGLAMIPGHVLEAAATDGATPWRRLWSVTLPLMTPAVLVVLMFRTIDALRAFDIVFGLTGGGPGSTTEVISSFTYRFCFSYLRYGQGSAFAVVTLVLVMVVSLVYVRSVVPHLHLDRDGQE